jgi:alpha-galactosidase
MATKPAPAISAHLGTRSKASPQWSEWGFDYVKYDNCYSPFDHIMQQNQFGHYQRMSDAMATFAKITKSKPFEYSLCNWG